MKAHRIVTAGLVALSLGIGILSTTTPAHALASYWKSSHWVTLKKNITVYKVKSSSGKTVRTYKAKKGQHYKLSHWDVNYSWTFQSGKFNTNGKYTYTTHKAYNDGSWFKMGKHSLKKSSPKKAKVDRNYDLDYKEAPSSLSKCVGGTVYTTPLAGNNYSVGLTASKELGSDYVAEISHPGVPLHLNKLVHNETGRLADVQYNGKNYFALADSGLSDVVPYNTSVSGGVAQSSCKPTDKANIYVKSNQWVSTKDLWQYVNPNTGEETYYSFSLNKDKWYYNSALN